MKEIIALLVILGISWLFDQIKKFKAKHTNQKPPKIPHQYIREQEATVNTTRAESHLSEGFMKKEEHFGEGAMPRHVEYSPIVQSNKAESFLPGETIEAREEIEAMAQKEEEEKRRERNENLDPVDADSHFNRWRQAVIDSEILRPKYKSY